MVTFKNYFTDLLLIEQFVDDNEYDDVPIKHNPIPKKEISNKGDFVIRNGKMLFNRVGPISGQKQHTSKAPQGEHRGIWAFPFPIFDSFFVSGSFSHPSQMAPKDVNKRKLNQSERSELQKVADQKIKRMKEIKSSVINFKEIEKTNPDLAKEFYKLEGHLESINDLIKSKLPINLWTYYNAIGKGDEYDSKIAKEQPKAVLSDEERNELLKRKKHIENAMNVLTPKLKSGDENYHTVDHKHSELEYRLSDINELLSGEGSNTLKHNIFHGDKFNKVKKFWYGGPIYARFNDNGEIIGSGGSGNWHKFDNVTKYVQAARKWIISNSDAKKSGWWNGKKGDKPPMMKGILSGMGQGDYNVSIDHMEVFLPI